MERIRDVHPEGGPMMTKQSMAAESDINQIVARHVAHGVPFPEGSRATYGDFTGALDYHAALNSLIRAEQEFMRLPAAVRDHCGNDPGEFLDLVMDPMRRKELEVLGLVPEAVPAAAGGSPGGEVARAESPPAAAGSPVAGVSSSGGSNVG